MLRARISRLSHKSDAPSNSEAARSHHFVTHSAFKEALALN